MAEADYMSYEQVLQSLQTNRGQLNQFIRSGRLRQHVVDGETKFRRDEVEELKNELEKEPTVMEDWGEQEEGGTAILDEEGAPGEPETQVLEEEEYVGERTTEVIEEASDVPEPDTVMLEEPTEDPDTVMLEEEPAEESGPLELELEGEDMSPSESALETELDLETVSADEIGAEEEGLGEEEEDFFDFSGDLEDVDFELESEEEEENAAEAESEELVLSEDTEDVVTEVLDLGGDEDIAEEDLLSEIMDIEDEDLPGGEPIGEEASADITAEITTMEEPTYEESDLDELLEAEEDLGAFEEDFVAEEDFEVPYAAPMEAPGDVSPLFVGLLVLALFVMAAGGWFVIENSLNPAHDTWLGSKVNNMLSQE